VSDTKVTTTTFDDLFEEDQGHTRVKGQRVQREESTPDIRKAWAKQVDLEVMGHWLLYRVATA